MELYVDIFEEEVGKIIHQVGEKNVHHTKFELAIQLFDTLVLSEEFEEFLTLPAYQYI